MSKGKYVDLNTLTVGTKFHVVNGNWDGIVVEKDGVKYVEAYTTGYGKLVNTVEVSMANELMIKRYN